MQAFAPDADTQHNPFTTIPAVVQAVRSGEADYGVVPFYNSTYGAVTATLDSLAAGLQSSVMNVSSNGSIETTASQKPRLKVRGEVNIRIRHCLAGFSAASDASSGDHDKPLERRRKVYSHEQALGQCAQYLDRNLPDAERVAVPSTSRAAEMVHDEEGGVDRAEYNLAGICSEMAAEEYGVPILQHDVQDRDDNTTRFLLLGRNTRADDSVLRGGKLDEGVASRMQKSLIVFTVPHSMPGALVKALTAILRHGLNMTAIHQRPPDEQREDDAIFIEVEGPFSSIVIEELEQVTGSVRWLGSWRE